MATSGSFTTNAVDGLALIFNWSTSSQDVTNNLSTISWNLVGSKSSGYTYAGTFNVVVNGATVYSSATRIPVYNGTVVASGTTTIGHNSDGTKNFSASASAAIYYYTVNSSGSGSWDLTTIPRASSFTLSSSNFEIGSSIAIAISRASTAFTHKVILAFGNYSEVLSSSATTSYTWATGSYLSNLANQIPSATSGTGHIEVQTYNGSTLIGTARANFTANLASTVVPTCGALSVAEANSVVSALSAGYIKGYTKLLIAIGASSGIYGSTISSYKITVDNQTFTTQSAKTNALSTAGSIVVTGTVTDSRGRTANKTVTITVVDYASPNVTSTATRKTGSATTMVVAVMGSITSLSSKNSATYMIKSKLKSAIDWTTKVSATAITGTMINLSREVTGYVVSSSYDVQIVVTDKLSTTTITLSLPTEAILLDVGKNGVGVGKYNETGEGTLDVKEGIYINGINLIEVVLKIQNPIGHIRMETSNVNPATYLGFGAWVAWGTGRVPVGINTSDTDFSTVDKTGGAKSHALTIAEMPAHNHTFIRPSWYIADYVAGGAIYSPNGYKTSTTVADSVSTSGGGQAHNNLQPYITCYMWKRTA